MTKKEEKILNIKAFLGTVSFVAIVASLGSNIAMAETSEDKEDKKLVSGNELKEAEYDNYYLEYMYENYLKENAKKMKEEKRRAVLQARGISDENAGQDEQQQVPCGTCAVQMQQMPTPVQMQQMPVQTQGQGVYFDIGNNQVQFGNAYPSQYDGANVSTYNNVNENDRENENGIFSDWYAEEDEEEIVARKFYDDDKHATDDVGGRRKNTEEEKVRDKDEDYDETLFYIRAIAGTGKLGKYKMSFTDTPNEKVNMKTDKKRLDVSVALGWGFANNWDLEIEGEKIDWKDIKPEKDINESLVEYNHKIKTVSAGINAIYNLNNYRTSWVTPFIGIGAGVSQFKVNDYGTVWKLNDKTEDANGDPVTEKTPGAEKVNFESETEKKTRPYVKAIAGITLRLSDYTSLLLKGDYKVFNDFTSPQGMKLSDLTSVSGSAGLRINF